MLSYPLNEVGLRFKVPGPKTTIAEFYLLLNLKECEIRTFIFKEYLQQLSRTNYVS